MEYEVPQTEQGLMDFIKFSKDEIKRSNRKIKNLEDTMEACHKRLNEITQAKEKEKNVQTNVRDSV
jgi:hypothetical protein